ncbi:uncharacterized protein [Rutidosis leptorrhynchoides]|uniref:uncharacterized protein n=1 Tax=Rutidosis leptorrhynchoides TaxID=125765 RepID=UPI003A9959AE
MKLEVKDDNDKHKVRTADVELCVMRTHSRYNTILGRTSLKKFGAIPSTVHRLVKFSTNQGIATLESTPREALCASVMIKEEVKSPCEPSIRCYLMINPTYPDQKHQHETQTFEVQLRGRRRRIVLGHLITTRGIKANPKKNEAIENMPSPKIKKKVQSLNGKIIVLTRFLSKAAERSLPFFSTLKNCEKNSNFKWTEEAEKAFQEMKALAIAPEAASSVLIAEREGVSAVKGQILADYLAETTSDIPIVPDLEAATIEAPELSELYTNGVCQECQLHALINKAPRHPMIPITSPWPFCKWAIDIVGQFPVGSGSTDYLVVAIDFFTKWVEAKPLKKITSKKIRDFLWESIVCSFTSVGHPQGNGQCEVTNRDIFHEIKARLGKQRKGWVEQLPKVFWAHRTAPKNSTGALISLVYGSEVVLPAEIVVPTERTLSFNQDRNARELYTNLDLLEERREMAAARKAIHKQQIARYCDKRVRLITYAVVDLV